MDVSSDRATEGVRRHVVAALVGRRCAAFELGVVHEVFGIDRSEYSDPWYECRVVAAFGSPIPVVDAGWSVTTPWCIEDLADADTIVVVVWPGYEIPAPPKVLAALREAHERGARIMSVCTGAFLLAEAGLLDGRRATTHWMHATALAERHPAVDVTPDVLFVDGGDGIYTSAGTAAGIDLCLHIVRLDRGAAVANAVARRMVVPPQRDGGQAQFVAAPVPEVPEGNTMAETLAWAVENLDRPLQVEELARRALLSPRTFARRFVEVTGATPARWLSRQRVLHAQHLLETTAIPVEVVAQRCGFGSGTTMRAHFRAVVGTSPLAYRRAFSSCDEPATG